LYNYSFSPRTESVVWNQRSAHTPLPWAELVDDDVYQAVGDDFENVADDKRSIEFLRGFPDFSRAIILVRGIDSASIDPGSWLFLHQRCPKLDITICFSVNGNFAEVE
jgi:hypothetical protein